MTSFPSIGFQNFNPTLLSQRPLWKKCFGDRALYDWNKRFNVKKSNLLPPPLLPILWEGYHTPSWARDLKNSGKYGSGLKLSLDLIYDLSFRIKAASYFPQSWIKKNGLIFYLADFHCRNWRIPSFMTQHGALFSTKTNQGRFYFHWA